VVVGPAGVHEAAGTTVEVDESPVVV
jgi:hypothetical protein